MSPQFFQLGRLWKLQNFIFTLGIFISINDKNLEAKDAFLYVYICI